MTINEEFIYCDHNGRKIFGKPLRLEGILNRIPLVIFSHELGMTHQSSLPYAQAIAHLGLAAYISDYGGGSLDSQSEG